MLFDCDVAEVRKRHDPVDVPAVSLTTWGKIKKNLKKIVSLNLNHPHSLYNIAVGRMIRWITIMCTSTTVSGCVERVQEIIVFEMMVGTSCIHCVRGGGNNRFV